MRGFGGCRNSVWLQKVTDKQKLLSDGTFPKLVAFILFVCHVEQLKVFAIVTRAEGGRLSEAPVDHVLKGLMGICYAKVGVQFPTYVPQWYCCIPV